MMTALTAAAAAIVAYLAGRLRPARAACDWAWWQVDKARRRPLSWRRAAAARAVLAAEFVVLCVRHPAEMTRAVCDERRQNTKGARR